MKVAAAIVGGGRALRMGGAPKHLLVVEGRRVVDRQLDVLRAVFPLVVVSANDAAAWAGLGVSVIPDRDPLRRAGPLAGLCAVLASPALDGFDAVVAVACDMPHLTEAVLTRLRDEAPAADLVAPRIAGRPEPLLARYGRGSLPALERALAAGALSPSRFLEANGAVFVDESVLRAVDPELRCLRNLNTPDALL